MRRIGNDVGGLRILAAATTVALVLGSNSVGGEEKFDAATHALRFTHPVACEAEARRLAEKVPQDSIILTLACGKYRFNRLEFGTLGGLPRLLDMGQCNDAYSAIKVASALADVFKVSVNELPLSLVLSWYEQKAVCILITLLSLGIKNIRLGPSLPAFVSPNVLKILVDKFDIKPITTADKDLADILAAKPV